MALACDTRNSPQRRTWPPLFPHPRLTTPTTHTHTHTPSPVADEVYGLSVAVGDEAQLRLVLGRLAAWLPRQRRRLRPGRHRAAAGRGLPAAAAAPAVVVCGRGGVGGRGRAQLVGSTLTGTPRLPSSSLQRMIRCTNYHHSQHMRQHPASAQTTLRVLCYRPRHTVHSPARLPACMHKPVAWCMQATTVWDVDLAVAPNYRLTVRRSTQQAPPACKHWAPCQRRSRDKGRVPTSLILAGGSMFASRALPRPSPSWQGAQCWQAGPCPAPHRPARRSARLQTLVVSWPRCAGSPAARCSRTAWATAPTASAPTPGTAAGRGGQAAGSAGCWGHAECAATMPGCARARGKHPRAAQEGKPHGPQALPACSAPRRMS